MSKRNDILKSDREDLYGFEKWPSGPLMPIAGMDDPGVGD
jgi:hypothetical protein